MSEETIEVTAEVIEPENALEAVCVPAQITDNLAALDAYIDKAIEPYIGAQIDPNDYEQVKEGRRCLADLNKLKAPIETERKRIKKLYEAPLKEWEAKVKGITVKIDEARSALKVQVDEADARFKEMRRSMLEEEYEGCAGVIADFIPFTAILDDTWLNRSTMESKAVNALYEKVERAVKGWETLQTKELKHKDEVVKHYAETLDVIAALELEDELNEKDREMQAFKEAQEAALQVAQQRREPEPVPDQEAPAAEATEAPAQFVWSLAMQFEGTKEFAQSVASTLKGMGITGASITCKGVVGNE